MNRRTQIGNILIYILQTEDTSTDSAGNYLSSRPQSESSVIWMGIVKAIFWTSIAIIVPVGIGLFTH